MIPPTNSPTRENENTLCLTVYRQTHHHLLSLFEGKVREEKQVPRRRGTAWCTAGEA